MCGRMMNSQRPINMGISWNYFVFKPHRSLCVHTTLYFMYNIAVNIVKRDFVNEEEYEARLHFATLSDCRFNWFVDVGCAQDARV